jgi:dTDP-4-amino-4,6-dideoxygalactose transaminase
MLRTELSSRIQGSAFLFASGREALLAFLRSCSFPNRSEIIVQGYTCVVVPNAIHAAGLVPVYADIEKDTLNLDPEDVEKRITPKTKAVICQHTFGIPAPVERLREICDRHGLLLIEDCAHVLPDADGPMEVMSKGDALLLSFGRDKAISGITGGAIVVRNKQQTTNTNQPANESVPANQLTSKPANERVPANELTMNLTREEHQAPELPGGTVLRLLLYPWLYFFARPLYGLGIGKWKLAAWRMIGLLVPIVTPEEKRGIQGQEVHAMPEACAHLILQQFRKLHDINDHRRSLVALYLEACAEHGWPVLHAIRGDLPLQKFPLFVPDADAIRRRLKRRNIHLDDGWTGCVVCPRSVSKEEAGYRKGSDPRAEEVSASILSLPTHPMMTETQTKWLISVLLRVLTNG